MKKGLGSLLIVLGIIAFVIIAILVLISYEQKDSGKVDLKTGNQSSNKTIIPQKSSFVLYTPKYLFYNFTDPNEKAFTIKIPDGWEVSEDSGLVRPYIDAGIMLKVTSKDNQGFFYVSPHGVYTTPNDLLNFAGFTEGKYYNPSGGIAKPMLVKKYTEAEDYLREFVEQLDVETKVLEVVDRKDLVNKNPGPLISKQSAAEITYLSNPGKNEIKNKIICYVYLMESSGVGIWASSMFGYYSNESLFNETEYLVLKSEETFKVDANWASREAQEVNKRAGIISSSQESISESISSTFEYKSNSMDRINDEWSKTMLGIEEVYSPETGDTWTVDSGSNYYWIDNKNQIYGTETDESPRPLEDIRPLVIK